MHAGLGWLLFRSKDYLPESLQFHENYLGAGWCLTVRMLHGNSSILLARHKTTI